MTYEMPKLPYANNALEPVISQQTIDYHYGKHLQTYVNNLNNLVPGTEYENKDLVTIVATAPDGAIFNNAGQVLNHTLYFLQFSPKPAHSEPTGKLAEAIKRDFGSFDNFFGEFTVCFEQRFVFVQTDADGQTVNRCAAFGSQKNQFMSLFEAVHGLRSDGDGVFAFGDGPGFVLSEVGAVKGNNSGIGDSGRHKE